jgi:RsiW-degrading membrane proteinase PrsW (M82 family)
MANLNFTTITYALLGGLLPALIWLQFWLAEDRKRAEPRGRLIATFVAGMLAVVLVLPFEKLINNIYGEGATAFFLWAVLEELFKFGAALQSRDDKEPVDPLIYMITAALGFAALENALFIINPLLQSNALNSFVTGDLRFIGSTLLHTVSSGAIGMGLALTFYKSKDIQVRTMLIALVAAICFHTVFNLLIINANQLGTFAIFAGVWAGITALIFMFEKVKAIPPPLSTSTPSTPFGRGIMEE